jgi:uncharacterized protein
MPEHSTPDARLDPRQPLVLDTRELGRRPGSMQVLRRTVPAPTDLGLALIAVPAGTDITLDLRLEAVMEGVLVSGQVTATACGECVRCLDPVETPIDTEICELYAYPGRAADAAVDDDLGHLVGDLIDLEPRLRDAIVLSLPLRPVCRVDCPGLCAGCGERLADLPPGHAHEMVDSRWAALRLVHTDADQSEG